MGGERGDILARASRGSPLSSGMWDVIIDISRKVSSHPPPPRMLGCQATFQASATPDPALVSGFPFPQYPPPLGAGRDGSELRLQVRWPRDAQASELKSHPFLA